MKKRLLLAAILAMLLCLVLAGCGEPKGISTLEVEWFAPTENLTYGEYVYDTSHADGYCPELNLDGKAVTIETIAIKDLETGEETIMGEKGSNDLVFKGEHAYEVKLWVDLGRGKTTDLQHIQSEQDDYDYCNVIINSNLVTFTWLYHVAAANPTVTPVAYNTYVDLPAPKIGETVAEENAKIKLTEAPDGVSLFSVLWYAVDPVNGWTYMADDDVFSYDSDSPEDLEYIATIQLIVPNDYDAENSITVVKAPRAREVSAPMLRWIYEKSIYIDITYNPSNLEQAATVDLVVDIGDVYLGDNIYDMMDAVRQGGKVTANGVPVKVLSMGEFMVNENGQWDYLPEDQTLFEASHNGKGICYYGFEMKLESSDMTSKESIKSVYIGANCAAQEMTEVVAPSGPYAEVTKDKGAYVTFYLDPNLMRRNYEFTGTVDVNLNLGVPYFGESVNQWIQDSSNYAYTSTKNYTFGEEMDITVSAVTGNGSEALSGDYILKENADIAVYVVRVVLHETGLTAGTVTKLNLLNEQRVSSWECSNVQENGDIIVDVVYAVSKFAHVYLLYDAYDVPTGMTVFDVVCNLPYYGTVFTYGKAPVELKVTNFRFLDSDGLPHNLLWDPDDKVLNNDDRFLADHEYCLEVTFATKRQTVDGLNNQNVKCIYGNFESGPIISDYDGEDGNMSIYLFFYPVDMGICEHAFNTEYVEGKEPTCTAEGEYLYTCSLCGYSYTAVAPVIDHDMKVKEKKDATCTEDGYTVYTCKNCGKTYTITSAAKGHSIEWTGDNYRHWLVCKKCGYVPADSKKDFHEWNGEDGVEVYVNGEYYYRYRCATCNRNYDKLIVN